MLVSFFIIIIMPKACKINLIGVLADGVMPTRENSSDETIYVYYRADGDLYLYDCGQEAEFNLMQLSL